jgi:hypothetical protein
MSAVLVGGVVCVLLTTGCAGLERAPPREAPPVAAPSGATRSIEPEVARPASVPQTTGTERETVTAEPKIPPNKPTVSDVTDQVAAKSEASPPKAPARVAAPPPPAAQPPRKEAPGPAIVKPEAPPPLDLKSLETRLKETKAIGAFTKLALKNQVDDLLDQFRAFYQGRLKTSLVELRRSYELLVLKVLALLQDADPRLASAIAASRESIWGILSNPAKFAAV